MKLTIRHEVTVVLPPAAGRIVMHLLLMPRSAPGQSVREWKLELPPEAAPTSFADAFGNKAVLAGQAKPGEQWVVISSGTVETADRSGVLGRILGEPVPRLYLRQTEATQPNSAVVAAVQRNAEGKDRIALLHKLMFETLAVLRIRPPARTPRGRFQSQTQSQGPSQVQTLTSGSTTPRLTAPELAHTFIGAARALGIPARYVTGYLAQEPSAAPAMHAWAEAYDDAIGWIGFDPLMQLCPTDRHVRVACGLDAVSTAPLRSIPAAIEATSSKLAIDTAA